MGWFSGRSKISVAFDQDMPSLFAHELDTGLTMLKRATAELSEVASIASQNIEKELSSYTQRFYTTIDAIDDLLLIKDSSGRWKTLNIYGQKLFDIILDDYYNKTDEDIGKIKPHLKDTLEVCVETDTEAWRRGHSNRTIEIIKDASGNTRYFDVIKTPTYDAGEPKELIVVGRDITEPYLEHERTKACYIAMNSASHPIFIIDKNSCVFFCNDESLKYFHISNYKDAIGKHVKEILHNPEIYDVVWEVVKDGNIFDQTLPRDPSYRVTVQPIKNGHPYPVFYVVSLKPVI